MVELAGIIILGILAQWIAWRLRVPAILPLIILGLLVGPISTLYTPDGQKWLKILYDPATGRGLFPGDYLFDFVSLSVALILFEGGLGLKRREVEGVGSSILKLISLGSLITFVGGGLGAYLLLGLNWEVALMFGALIVVTGPTVILPILRNLPLTRNVAAVLKWESILIDPIGALLAVLAYQFVLSAEGGVVFTLTAVLTFLKSIAVGVVVGSIAAWLLYNMIRRDWIPAYLLNVFILAFVLGSFVLSGLLAQEAGLLTVVVMGAVLGNLDVPRLTEILSFKESLSILLISVLFILLAAHINLPDLQLVTNDWRSYALLGLVVLVLRPLGVFLSTQGSNLTFAEKFYVSWVGPRGIVAAGMASLFGLTLTRMQVPDAEYITPLVFFIVLGTVLLISLSVRTMVKALGVTQPASRGILFVGANQAARVLAKYLQENRRHVVLIDSNEANIQRSREMGLEAFNANVYSEDLGAKYDLVDVGFIIAMTSSPELNQYALRRYRGEFGQNGAYRLISGEELRRDPSERPQADLLSHTDDFLNFNEVARDFPEMHEWPMSSKIQLRQRLEEMALHKKSIPVFVKDTSGEIHIIPGDPDTLRLANGPFSLVYLGEKVH